MTKSISITNIAIMIVAVVFAFMAFASMASAGNPHTNVTTIQDGILLDSEGNFLSVGYNTWGYNYQAHLFNGKYCDSYRDAAWCQDYKNDSLTMKWNDAWLANTDADGDGLLDRHFGYSSYIGSGAWLTNHISGEYVQDGKTYRWSEFYKIVAAPADAYVDGGFWYDANGGEIGEVIWGQFAMTEYIYNDSGTGDHGVVYKSPTGPGLGNL
ncbi:hypothetical protein A2592_02370 [Candidatus Kaiserbacteria bacterium RIFOXYD1_FULL_42_15]|uniref:Uncharacterized protein n=1 Tax=Candidatus Kaiserbacteria bacterium RIFOXYD1_FULL_42_15 TaxID=1798532 RepID=A0A1F6FRT2_9BACT|nr:MAG: hypothetical protein A2592_02370 [Candidatus Kaiserbacteria bacterium RIFOXYD1_FULL_42_15]